MKRLRSKPKVVPKLEGLAEDHLEEKGSIVVSADRNIVEIVDNIIERSQ